MRASEFTNKAREDFEGITIEMEKPFDGKLIIRALDDWGNKMLGFVVFNIGDSNELDPQDLSVDEKYQGQGIAKAMYDYVKSKGYKIIRSWDQTDSGAGFWNKHRGEDVRVWEGQLNELGNSPSEYKPNRKRKRSLFHATVDNNWVDVFFDRSEFNGTLHITFTVNGDYDTPSQPTSASKSTVKILSTVLNIIKQQLPEYIKKSRPPGISFTAKGDSRASLYRKYFVPTVQNILGPKWQHEEYPSMGMIVFHWKPVKNQDVTEVVNKELWHPERMFNQRVPIGDYEFEAREAIGGLGDYDADALTIIAYDPKRKKDKGSIGHARFVVKGRGSRRSLVSDDTYVDPKYRGEGIATMMYAYAKSLGNDIKGSNIQTPMGKKMWANWGSDAEHLKGNK